MQLNASRRVTLLSISFLLLIPGIVWLAQEQSLGVFSVVALGAALFIALIALTSSSKEDFWPWFLGVFFLVLPPFLLLLGGLISHGDAKSALYAWVFVYAAGVAGGLVLELIRGKGRLELPSYFPASAPETTAKTPHPAPSNPGPENGHKNMTAVGVVEVAGERKPEDGEKPREPSEPVSPDADEDPFAPYGPRADTGFLARLTLGGLAGAVFTALIEVLTNSVEVADLGTVGRQLDTMAWSALLGFAALTVWAGAEALVGARLETLKSALDVADTALTSVQNNVQNIHQQHAESVQVLTLDPVESLGTSFKVDDREITPDELKRLLQSADYIQEPVVAAPSPAVVHLAKQSLETQRQLAQVAGTLNVARNVVNSARRRARAR